MIRALALRDKISKWNVNHEIITRNIFFQQFKPSTRFKIFENKYF